MVVCPFIEIFAQESNGSFGCNYLTGLLWALEGLAWAEEYLVRVCNILGELANNDPGGQWSNRPFNSLTTILLPWFPQTMASIEKKKVVVQVLLHEWPEVAWKLLIQLLPNKLQTSFGSHKPQWHMTIPEEWGKNISNDEYWELVFFYAEAAVKAAEQDTNRLITLIEDFNQLPKSAFNLLVEILSTDEVIHKPEEQRRRIWDSLKRLTTRHSHFAEANWALPGSLVLKLEKIAQQYVPSDPFFLYQRYFSDEVDFEFYKKDEDWTEQQKKLTEKRVEAITTILAQGGVELVMKFAETVKLQSNVGDALVAISDKGIEQQLLPYLLDNSNSKHRALISGFIWSSHRINGWEWCDVLDKSTWTSTQIAEFLTFLPFCKGTWDRANQWLMDQEMAYWTITSTTAYVVDEYLSEAVVKLVEYGRPRSAITSLDRMRSQNIPVDIGLYVNTLIDAIDSDEPEYSLDIYHTTELIKSLQLNPSVPRADLYRIEWAYLSLMDGYNNFTPRNLELRLSENAEFFCEMIRLIYRSDREVQPQKESSDISNLAYNAFRLLGMWRTPPGTQLKTKFDANHFNEWLHRVKEICIESGHLDIALIEVGKVLIYSPPDDDGLWINKTIAKVLNDRNAEKLRSGYKTARLNSRGVHVVDPSGSQERELAKRCREQAEAVENQGFQRFAIVLRSLAVGYDREAESILTEQMKVPE